MRFFYDKSRLRRSFIPWPIPPRQGHGEIRAIVITTKSLSKMTIKYSEKVIEHFKNPHNMGQIKNADGIGVVDNRICGDMMKLYIKVGQNEKGEKIISDIKFETLGCAAAIATSSMITDIAKGKTLYQAKKITRQSVADHLGGLPPIKMHCSNLAADALSAAILDYEKKEGKI